MRQNEVSIAKRAIEERACPRRTYREDSASVAAEKASTVETSAAGGAQLFIPQASMCSRSSDRDEKEHAQDDESGDDAPEGTGVKESKRQGRGRDFWKTTPIQSNLQNLAPLSQVNNYQPRQQNLSVHPQQRCRWRYGADEG